MSAKLPAARDDLWLYVHRNLGVRLGHKAFTPGHSTPLDFVADALRRPGADLAVWANRSGMKTLSASIIAALEFRFSPVSVRARVLSGSEDQAKHLYGYWARWCESLLGDLLVREVGRHLTRLENGDLEILAASQKRVRGAKVQRLFRDEVDEIDPDVLAASVGMLASRDGAAARMIDTSTWHHAGGPMSRLVAQAAERGIGLHKWNIWETIQRCPPERHDNGRNCSACRLAGPCVAKARQYYSQPDRQLGIAADACGVLAIDDAIKQLSQWSRQQWQAEAECQRPSLEGLIYPAFDRRTHVERELVLQPNLPTYRAIDWGFNEFVCLWIQLDKDGTVYVVDEYCANHATTADNAREVRTRHDSGSGVPRIEATYCDPAGASRNDQTGYSDVQVFESMGIPCNYATSPWAREVRNGINLLRSCIQPAFGPPRLKVAASCTRLIEAFESYRSRRVNGQYIDEPVKPQPCDHAMDALRYFAVNRCSPRRNETRRMSYA